MIYRRSCAHECVLHYRDTELLTLSGTENLRGEIKLYTELSCGSEEHDVIINVELRVKPLTNTNTPHPHHHTHTHTPQGEDLGPKVNVREKRMHFAGSFFPPQLKQMKQILWWLYEGEARPVSAYSSCVLLM